MAEKEGDSISKYLVLWIQYNKAAIKNSKNLCRVLVETTKLYEDVNNESERIVSKLSEKCNVDIPQMEMNEHVGNNIFDQLNIVSLDEMSYKILETYNECEIHDNETNDIDERRLYIEAMELYCDLISGKVLRDNYLWPQMRQSVVASVFETGIPKYQVEEKVREMYIKDVKNEKPKKKRKVGKVKHH